VRVGNCTHPDLAILSFHPVKHITTGEGGAILTNNDRLADQATLLRSHGIRNQEAQIPGWEGPWHLEMTNLGYNYRLTDLQAALGLSQLRKLDQFVAKRRAIAKWYEDLLNCDDRFARPALRPGVEHAYHLYILRVAFGEGTAGRKAFYSRCLERGVRFQVHYRPIPLNSFYRDRVAPGTLERLPNALRYYRECFSAPMYPQLTQDDIAYVIETLRVAAPGQRNEVLMKS